MADVEQALDLAISILAEDLGQMALPHLAAGIDQLLKKWPRVGRRIWPLGPDPTPAEFGRVFAADLSAAAAQRAANALSTRLTQLNLTPELVPSLLETASAIPPVHQLARQVALVLPPDKRQQEAKWLAETFLDERVLPFCQTEEDRAELWERYLKDRVLPMAERSAKCGSVESTDLLQEGFLKLEEVFGRFDRRRGAFWPWLATILNRRFLDVTGLRRRVRPVRGRGGDAAPADRLVDSQDPGEVVSENEVVQNAPNLRRRARTNVRYMRLENGQFKYTKRQIAWWLAKWRGYSSTRIHELEVALANGREPPSYWKVNDSINRVDLDIQNAIRRTLGLSNV
jgi:DNA-directed RNA polymerase specialized sigma24 family protein